MPNATLKSLEQALQDSEARYAKLKGEYLSTQQTTQELMAAQTLTQSMLNNAAEGMITFATDNTVMSFNHAAQNLLGAREVDVLHQQIDNLFEIPSDFDSITEYMRAYCQTHSDHEMLDDPLFALKADGTRVPLRVTISEVRSSDMVLFDEDESVDPIVDLGPKIEDIRIMKGATYAKTFTVDLGHFSSKGFFTEIDQDKKVKAVLIDSDLNTQVKFIVNSNIKTTVDC